MTDDGGPSFPTLRCPECGHADLLFGPSGRVRCGHCMRTWTREELARTRGTAGSSFDRDVKDEEEG